MLTYADACCRLYRRAITLNPTGAEVLYSYGLLLFQVDGNLEAAEEVLVRGLRVDPLSVAMNYAHGLLLRDGKRRRDQAKDSFEWVAQQVGGRDNADAVLAAGAVYVCSRMLTYSHVCSRRLTYARVCSRRLT